MAASLHSRARMDIDAPIEPRKNSTRNANAYPHGARIGDGAPQDLRPARHRRAGALTPVFVVLIVLTLLFNGCGGGSSEETRKSWRATLRFTAEQWLRNSVPSSFVRATCEKAKKELPREAEELEQAVARNDRRAVARFAESVTR